MGNSKIQAPSKRLEEFRHESVSQRVFTRFVNSEVALKIAPGMRIELRNVEWLVNRTLTTDMKLHLIEAIGLSEILCDQEMSFILAYETEGTGKIMDPADVALVPDASARYVQTLLYIESLLRTAAPKGPTCRLDRGRQLIRCLTNWHLLAWRCGLHVHAF